MVRFWLLAGWALLLLGCSSGADSGRDRGEGASGEFLKGFDVSDCNIPSTELADGGPPPDGIPAILDPIYKDLPDVLNDDDLPIRDDDLFLIVEIGGEVRAYPEVLLWNHEIINDVLGGEPIVVSYCPLTGSPLVFDRANDEEQFAVSGLLFESNLVMFDGVTGSLFPQMNLEGACGPRIGEALQLRPVQEMNGAMLKQLYPQVNMVINGRRTNLNYGPYPYGSYDELGNGGLLFPVSSVDVNLPIKSLVLSVFGGSEIKGYPHLVFGGDGIVNDLVGGDPLVVFHIESGTFANAYSRVVDGETLSFDLVADSGATGGYLLRDEQTGSHWDLLGHGVSGTHQGKRLEQMLNFNAMWFSFKVSFPDADVFNPQGKRKFRLEE